MLAKEAEAGRSGLTGEAVALDGLELGRVIAVHVANDGVEVADGLAEPHADDDESGDACEEQLEQ